MKRILLCIVIMFVLSISYIVSGYSSANVLNNANVSIVNSGDALLAVPNNQVVEIKADDFNRITVINNTSESLKIHVPKVTQNKISVEGKPDVVLPGSQHTIPNYELQISAPDGADALVEITVIAESLDGDFKAEIKNKIRIIKR